MAELTCFKAYDIRGQLESELNDEIAYRIGRAFGEYLLPDTVVLGSDARLTSESLKQSLARGLLDAGSSVIDIGLSCSEELYFATAFLAADGGIEVTGSHNPEHYNGMKLVCKNARPISSDSGLWEIKALAEKEAFSPAARPQGDYLQADILDNYIDHILSYVDLSRFKPMKLLVNAGNGTAGHVIDAIERRFRQHQVPLEFIKIQHEPDGSFPHGVPNPLLPERRQDTAEAVRRYGADMGIAFDGDADRCFLFDDQGNFIEGYYIVGLLAEAFLRKQPGEKIVHDPRLSWNTVDIVNQAGGIPVMSKTGHAFIKERMRAEDAVYGGEMSAHHYFRDFYYCDSGMIPWLMVAEIMSLKNRTLAQLVEERIQAYPSSGEINIVLEPGMSASEIVERHYREQALDIDMTDGISMTFAEWRFNLRESNTEPLTRLNVESRGDRDLMQRKTAEILALLRG
ncbi:Phosphomannomutase/phosphoglucomutase [Serratia entomophila]|uniref:phosphomannomutase CpsG n=1 Tax=Serratia entomophila TaxID=42906 RepID=UPI001F33CD2E|nr:phosphomannomutase CpsG [Serratia entomophila]UIW19916.1 phosphomannomutase CpsG [Serratia entomophila]CAI0758176.1 Phosphomannomutase/phosphoglucomutase [Serratia entomophila]CAI0770008.1 Phosphomannomutase/phosphoglucomutase [Serratia entomophila]CAI0774086.1 Phosphomannomutase/phosphoglucomutase [Serratia entomophila]CAI0778552.1 Phosphomannomutase/phosphoglucomutase [Serratia entomophila]